MQFTAHVNTDSRADQCTPGIRVCLLIDGLFAMLTDQVPTVRNPQTSEKTSLYHDKCAVPQHPTR